MDLEICQYYLHLLHSGKIPVPVLSRLLMEFGSAQALRTQSESVLKNLGFGHDQINVLRAPSARSNCARQVEEALEWSNRPLNYLLCYESENYPNLLREIDTAPPLLFVRGSLSVLRGRLLSVVGSRKASIYGTRNAFWLARELSNAGLHITSGLANGIDTRAHEGALDGSGKTIAVVGTGIDRVYPARNAALGERIAEKGAIVSEFPLGTAPYPNNFPRRNRIISGLAEGTVVIEGSIKSGSLITARLAMEQNRDVFALPGLIGSRGSRGCHRLIKQGAKLVEDPADILEELGIDAESTCHKSLEVKAETKLGSKREARVLDAIQQHGSLFETILVACNLEMQELNAELLKLEADGLIQQQGGRYYRNP